ncbi:hypothetical protein [Cellulomonas denverensis]|uniref:Uncharacterized protein n=1 Tax=Cellulomonas denverensis TaxID=264297 RepID=A0A7X6KTH8_9CELL|nr:hypothetical protein [Cellulomonas denverensis]NKY22011.1 hypothetical protein [Cellulomonas denverensis]GIG24096.1 hypothetical protein Cde04nite_03400 [Cellulomonas denverensis]
MRKSLARAAAIVFAAAGAVGAVAVTPAVAATPGSACTITIDRIEVVGASLEAVHVVFPGTVSSYQASTCIPTTPIEELNASNTYGTGCNEPLFAVGGVRIGYTNCPN